MNGYFYNAPSRSVTTINAFTGYNHSPRCAEGEMYDMKAMCGDRYPFLSTRAQRGEFKRAYNSLGNLINEITNVIITDFVIDGVLYTNGAVCYALDPNKIYCLDFYDSDFNHLGKTVELEELTEVQNKLIAMNGYLICFPSGYYLNLFNLAEPGGFIGAEVIYDRPATEASANVVATTFVPCTEDGQAIEINTSKPESPKNGDYWSEDGVLKVYNATYERWDSVVTNYTKMYFPAGSGVKYADMAQFTRGDYVEIGEIEADGVTKRKKQYFQFVSDDGTASSSDLEYIILQGKITYASIAANSNEATQKVYIRRPMPSFDHVFQHNNRLWGCYYGIGEDGKVINEIYASALGDFKNWYKYEGTSMDAWTATMSVPGKWTGAISYGGYPIFFKEKAIVKIYGTAPSSFQSQIDTWRGVKDGSAESLAIVNEVLYYLSESGIVAYNGGIPQNIDSALKMQYGSIIGEGCRGKYFFKSTADISDMYFYDTQMGVWYKDGSHNARFLREIGDNILSVQKNGAKLLFGESDTVYDWYCETADLGYGSADYKYISRLQARVRLQEGYEMKVYISYDGGEWEPVGSFFGNGSTPVLCEVLPVRCDFFRLRFEGKGEADIINYSYLTEEGSSNYES